MGTYTVHSCSHLKFSIELEFQYPN